MKCNFVKDNINEYINGELKEEEQLAIKSHIDECENCRALYEEELYIDRLFKDALIESNDENLKFESITQGVLNKIDKNKYSNKVNEKLNNEFIEKKFKNNNTTSIEKNIEDNINNNKVIKFKDRNQHKKVWTNVIYTGITAAVLLICFGLYKFYITGQNNESPIAVKMNEKNPQVLKMESTKYNLSEVETDKNNLMLRMVMSAEQNIKINDDKKILSIEQSNIKGKPVQTIKIEDTSSNTVKHYVIKSKDEILYPIHAKEIDKNLVFFIVCDENSKGRGNRIFYYNFANEKSDVIYKLPSKDSRINFVDVKEDKILIGIDEFMGNKTEKKTGVILKNDEGYEKELKIYDDENKIVESVKINIQ